MLPTVFICKMFHFYFTKGLIMAKQMSSYKKNNSKQVCNKNCMQKRRQAEQAQNALEQFFNHTLNPWQISDNSPWLEPNIEVSENAKSIQVSAELPGMAPQDIQVDVSQDGYLTISGEKHHQTEETDEQTGAYFSERSYGMIQRTVPLPTDLNYDKTSANFENGVLCINIPKTEVAARKVKRVAVQGK